MPELYCPNCHWFGNYDERERHSILCFEICPIAKKELEKIEKNKIETKKNIEYCLSIV